MTKKRLLLFAGFLAACVCLPLGVVATLPPGPGVTKVTYDRIEKGMTRNDVNAVFGTPNFREGVANSTITWWGNDGYVEIKFDFDERVIRKSWLDISRNETTLQKLNRILPWNKSDVLPPGRYF